MSDITKAFEILVSMDPSQATGAFKSIVDSQEKTTSSFEKFLDIGAKFNQLWELIGKGADVVLGLAGSVSDLADSGGELNEVEGNFKKLAASAGIAGDDFLTTIKKVTDGNISLKETAALSSAAIVQGFSGEQITSAFKFAQQLSDQGKGNVEDLFSTITESTAKGRTASLAAFGIIAESGASAAQVFDLINEKVSNAGEGFFNFGDNLKSISTSFVDFKDRVGQALNQSEAFQKVVQFITDEVTDFVGAFDFSQIGLAFDYIIKAGFAVAESLGIDFSDIKKTILSTFAGGNEFVKSFILNSIDAFGLLRKTVANTFNDLLTLLGDAFAGFAEFYNSIKFGAASIGVAFDNAWITMKTGLFSAISAMVEQVDYFAEKFPKIAEVLGLQDNGLIGEAKNTIKEVFEEASKGAEQAKEANKLFLEELASDLDRTTSNASKVFEGFKIDTSQYDTQLEDLTTKLKDIAPELIDNATKGVSESTRKGIDELRAEMKGVEDDEKRRIKEHEETVKESYKREAKAAEEAFSFAQSQEEKAFKRSQEDAFEAYKEQLLKDRRFQTGEGTFTTFRGNVNEEEKALYEKALKEFRRKQEDSLDLFKFEQKKKEIDLENVPKIDINRDETADEVKKLVDIQESTAKKAEQSQKQTVFKLKIDPTGNSALDILLENLLATAEVRAEAELVEVIAG